MCHVRRDAVRVIATAARRVLILAPLIRLSGRQDAAQLVERELTGRDLFQPV
jgi:hypothetical protein